MLDEFKKWQNLWRKELPILGADLKFSLAAINHSFIQSVGRLLTGNRKEVKKGKVDKPKVNPLDQKRREEGEEIKGEIKGAVEAWQAYYEEAPREEETEEAGRKEREVMDTAKKRRGSRLCSDRGIHQRGARSPEGK